MYSTLDKISSLPNWLRGIVGMVLRATGKPRMADLLTNAVGMDALALWNLHVEQLRFQDALIEQWRQSRLDLVICPSLGLPALKHGGSKDLTVACCYTFLWNLVHFPAGIVPVSHVKPDECQ
jgi:fatty acid amide hydrolase